MDWVYNILNTIWLLICEGIYIFIGLLYQVFQKVASVNLFSQEIFEEFTGRMYLVIGIAMLFIFAYNIILAIVNPDGKDKGTTNLAKSVKQTVISLVLVVLLPTIFNWLYVFQTHVLESNIIGTIILGGVGSTSGNSSNCAQGDYDCNCSLFENMNMDDYSNHHSFLIIFQWNSTSDITQTLKNSCENYKTLPASQRGAYSIAPTIFSTFYRPAKFTFEDCENYLLGNGSSNISTDKDKKICVNYFGDVVLSKYSGNIGPFVRDSYLKDIISDSSDDSMEFHWIMAIVAGILALYMFFCYAMEVGVRVAKLGFLQLISPIPVMMRIIPGQKEKIYDKWLNHLKNAYLDVFIRLAIIYFALFGVSLVPDVINTMWNSVWDGQSVSTNLLTNFFVKALVTVFVILGLLKFAQDAPALFKEFFVGSGAFALKSPKRQLQENKLAMGGMGMIGGAASGFVKNIGKGNPLAGAVSGAFRGAKAGYGSNSFKALRSNVSGAVDRVVRAREDRDARQKYQRKDLNGNNLDGFMNKGALAYRADQLKDSWNKWTNGESYDFLNDTRSKYSEMEKKYNDIIAAVEKQLDDKPTKFSYDGRSFDQWIARNERAKMEYNTFDKDTFVKNYIATERDLGNTSITREQAELEANKRFEQLMKALTDTSNDLQAAKKGIVDSVIDLTESTGKTTGEFKQMFEDGREVMIKSDENIAGLKEKIEVASKTFTKDANMLSSDTREVLNSDSSIREKRNTLRNDISTLDSKIAALNQLQKEDKK